MLTRSELAQIAAAFYAPDDEVGPYELCWKIERADRSLARWCMVALWLYLVRTTATDNPWRFPELRQRRASALSPAPPETLRGTGLSAASDEFRNSFNRFPMLLGSAHLGTVKRILWREVLRRWKEQQ